ncbi:MAG TPA: hypothetical protein VNW92_10410, partial [Polyangiaceae bacterium]|nr:hypothetical protein [Polyangiaceae bacterium]
MPKHRVPKQPSATIPAHFRPTGRALRLLGAVLLCGAGAACSAYDNADTPGHALGTSSGGTSQASGGAGNSAGTAATQGGTGAGAGTGTGGSASGIAGSVAQDGSGGTGGASA